MTTLFEERIVSAQEPMVDLTVRVCADKRGNKFVFIVEEGSNMLTLTSDHIPVGIATKLGAALQRAASV